MRGCHAERPLSRKTNILKTLVGTIQVKRYAKSLLMCLYSRSCELSVLIVN